MLSCAIYSRKIHIYSNISGTSLSPCTHLGGYYDIDHFRLNFISNPYLYLQIVGSSLLFVHDSTGKASIWMIDFGKTTPLPDGMTLTHRAEWVEGNHEDGYLIGIDNLINLFEDMGYDDGYTPDEKAEPAQS